MVPWLLQLHSTAKKTSIHASFSLRLCNEAISLPCEYSVVGTEAEVKEMLEQVGSYGHHSHLPKWQCILAGLLISCTPWRWKKQLS